MSLALVLASATATVAGPTAVCLQLATGVEAPGPPLEALRQGLERGGEPAVIGPPLPPSCAGELACVQTALGSVGAGELLFVVLVGLDETVQVAATRSDGRSPPEDLPLETVARDQLEMQIIELGRSWARPRTVVVPPAPAPDVRLDPSSPGPAVWTGVAVSGATLVAGVVAGLVALETRNQLEADGCGVSTRCGGARIDGLAREATTADVLFATAGVAAVVSLVLYLDELEVF